MRTKLLIIALFAVLSISATEPKDVSLIEVELKGGTNVPFSSYHGGSHAGLVLGLDFRYNLKNLPFDVGASFISNWTRGEGSNVLILDDEVIPYDYYSTNRAIGGIITAGYNLKRGYKVNPYAGLGVGVANTKIVDAPFESSATKAVFVPKIGVELLYNFRLEISTVVTRNHFNSLNFTLGLVFGGRPQKVKTKSVETEKQ